MDENKNPVATHEPVTSPKPSEGSTNSVAVEQKSNSTMYVVIAVVFVLLVLCGSVCVWLWYSANKAGGKFQEEVEKAQMEVEEAQNEMGTQQNETDGETTEEDMGVEDGTAVDEPVANGAVQTLSIGETASTDDWEFTLNGVSTDGDVLILEAEITNKQADDSLFSSVISMRLMSSTEEGLEYERDFTYEKADRGYTDDSVPAGETYTAQIAYKVEADAKPSDYYLQYMPGFFNDVIYKYELE